MCIRGFTSNKQWQNPLTVSCLGKSSLVLILCSFILNSANCETVSSSSPGATNLLNGQRPTGFDYRSTQNNNTQLFSSSNNSISSNIDSITQQDTTIGLLLSDIQYLQSQPQTPLTTPCIESCRDTTYTRIWTLENWKDHTKHALTRYIKHVKLWPNSTTMKSIIGAVVVSTIWSALVSILAEKYGAVQQTLSKFTITLTFLQAPILLLLTLRTNRSLDRLLEARKAWGALFRATRSLTGLVCVYVIPNKTKTGCNMARLLCICGWVLKGLVRGEDDKELINSIMRSVPEESEWFMRQNELTDIKSAFAVTYRLRNYISSLQADVPPIILLRMEEILCEIETSYGVCNRILTSPIPPTYTRHTSRVLVMYLSMLPVALVGMGISPLAVVITVACASYILIGIDEIGLEIEHPFPLMPLWGLSKGIESDVCRQVQMIEMKPSKNVN